MDESILNIGLYLLAALATGAAVGWFIKGAVIGNTINTLNEDWQSQLDDVVRHRDRLTAEATTLRKSVEAQEAVVHQRDMAVTRMRTGLESALEKEKLLKKSIFTLRAEREDFKTKISAFQNRMATLQQQSTELQGEFLKSRNFYVGELGKSFEKRKVLEEKIDNSRLERESFSNLLLSSRSEHESANRMLAAAKARLDNLDELEKNVIQLEAENAQLKHDVATHRQETDALKRNVAEQDELKVQNKELAQVLKSMENSRNQYEDDANRYRKHADNTEKKSETLRVRLDEVEKNFQEIEAQQRDALKSARESAAMDAANDASSREREIDDLQEIIGIGKVFEHSLHELGIRSFRQIANFDVSDVARVNAELKEFKGRMEQDDWIGQAKDLLFKKYG